MEEQKEMTKNEAIKILMDEAVKNYSWSELFKAIRIAIVALRRSDSGKVENVTMHVDHMKGNCPICKTKLSNYGDLNYCYMCGKKLDWTN